MITGKEVFKDKTKRQGIIVKKVLFLTFTLIGLAFVIIGVLIGSNYQNDMYMLCYMGCFFIFLGIILYFLVPTEYNYEKYNTRVERYGGYNVYELIAKVKNLEEKNAELEKRITEIEKKN